MGKLKKYDEIDSSDYQHDLKAFCKTVALNDSSVENSHFVVIAIVIYHGRGYYWAKLMLSLRFSSFIVFWIKVLFHEMLY